MSDVERMEKLARVKGKRKKREYAFRVGVHVEAGRSGSKDSK